jgi:hypothetical protein
VSRTHDLAEHADVAAPDRDHRRLHARVLGAHVTHASCQILGEPAEFDVVRDVAQRPDGQ